MCKVFSLDSQKYTIILYYYSMFKNVCSSYIRRMTGVCLHFRTSVRLPEAAYLMFSRLDPHFEFDTEFDKTLKNQCFSPFQHHQKSSKTPSKIPSNPWKIRLQSNLIKNHKIFSKIFIKYPKNLFTNSYFFSVKSGISSF